MDANTLADNRVRSPMIPRVAICFLVVNDMKTLSALSITSAFDRTKAEILVGYLDEADLPVLRRSLVFQGIKLENSPSLGLIRSTNTYSDFSEDDFYKIVQLKWELLKKAFALGYEYVIYSDTDVYWNLDPISEILETFSLRPDAHIQIQSFTDLLSQPKLCMGFVVFRNSEFSINFIEECKSLYREISIKNSRIGDDDLVTQIYREKNFPNSILELPQTSFPVGRMLKLYSKQSKFPGLPSPIPYVFHANYVVGLRNKIILMKLFISNYSIFDRRTKIGIKHHLILQMQKIRLLINRIRRSLSR